MKSTSMRCNAIFQLNLIECALDCKAGHAVPQEETFGYYYKPVVVVVVVISQESSLMDPISKWDMDK